MAILRLMAEVLNGWKEIVSSMLNKFMFSSRLVVDMVFAWIIMCLHALCYLELTSSNQSITIAFMYKDGYGRMDVSSQNVVFVVAMPYKHYSWNIYLYASNVNVANFDSVKLSGHSNYHMWKAQMLSLMDKLVIRDIVENPDNCPMGRRK
ncbi:Ankyrin repeat-containing protein [Artemisia annua]|uniref:Ankyrin repeat-containing protein n=1 Tax=Artemisia annua TaxID=35608 RepID=A0A2U1Q6M3_ARTAN|nr:Ankyrin repeat-containing protein [Artemisia annua]